MEKCRVGICRVINNSKSYDNLDKHGEVQDGIMDVYFRTVSTLHAQDSRPNLEYQVQMLTCICKSTVRYQDSNLVGTSLLRTLFFQDEDADEDIDERKKELNHT